MDIVRAKLRNVGSAVRALRFLLREEPSFQVLAWFAIGTVALSYALRITTIDFMVVLLTIGIVLATEALNTAIEELCDHLAPEEHERVGLIKDIASAALLLVMFAALCIGIIIFLPPLVALL